MKVPRIIDQYGNPVQSRALTQEIAAPQVTGVRRSWPTAVATGMTPDRLAGLLRNADQGDHHAALMLAGEMEERDLHYLSVLGTRKRAISGIKPTVIAGGSDARSEEIAGAVNEIVADPAFRDLVDDLLDGLGKGYSLCEIMWAKGPTSWTPKRYVHRPGWFFHFDKETGHEFRLAETGNPEGVPLPPYKFIAHVPKLRTGQPSRGGLGRVVAWAFMFKSFTIRDWMAFIESYGQPIRVGKYGPQATEDDQEVLVEAVANLGTDAAAIIPESMRIEFVQSADTKGGAAVFAGMTGFLDAQVSKAVLGQTMTADDGSSKAQADVHNDVRHDIAEADAGQIATTINRDLIRPFVDLNFGPQEVYPAVAFPVVQAEDVQAITDSLTKLVPLGLEVAMADVRERLGFSEPDEDAVLLQAPQAAVATNGRLARVGLDRLRGSEPGSLLAANDQLEDDIDDIVEPDLEDWEEITDPFLAPVMDAIEGAATYQEAIARLTAAFPNMDTGHLVERLSEALFKAQALGDSRD